MCDGTANGVLRSRAVAPVGTTGGTYDVSNYKCGAGAAGTLRLDLNSSGTGITDDVGNVISTGFTNGETLY